MKSMQILVALCWSLCFRACMSERLKTVAIGEETHKELQEYCDTHGVVMRFAMNAAVAAWLFRQKQHRTALDHAKQPSRPTRKSQ